MSEKSTGDTLSIKFLVRTDLQDRHSANKIQVTSNVNTKVASIPLYKMQLPFKTTRKKQLIEVERGNNKKKKKSSSPQKHPSISESESSSSEEEEEDDEKRNDNKEFNDNRNVKRFLRPRIDELKKIWNEHPSNDKEKEESSDSEVNTSISSSDNSSSMDDDEEEDSSSIEENEHVSNSTRLCVMRSEPKFGVPGLGEIDHVKLYGISHFDLQEYFKITLPSGKLKYHCGIRKIMNSIAKSKDITDLDLMFPKFERSYSAVVYKNKRSKTSSSAQIGKGLGGGPTSRFIHIGLIPFILNALPNSWKAINSVVRISTKLKNDILALIDRESKFNKRFIWKQLEILQSNINFISDQHQLENMTFTSSLFTLHQDYLKMEHLHQLIDKKIEKLQDYDEIHKRLEQSEKDIKKLRKIAAEQHKMMMMMTLRPGERNNNNNNNNRKRKNREAITDQEPNHKKMKINK